MDDIRGQIYSFHETTQLQKAVKMNCVLKKMFHNKALNHRFVSGIRLFRTI